MLKHGFEMSERHIQPVKDSNSVTMLGNGQTRIGDLWTDKFLEISVYGFVLLLILFIDETGTVSIIV